MKIKMKLHEAMHQARWMVRSYGYITKYKIKTRFLIMVVVFLSSQPTIMLERLNFILKFGLDFIKDIWVIHITYLSVTPGTD